MKRSLTDVQALWAIEQVKNGKMTQTQVAAHLGASLARINALVNGRSYRHLHGIPRGTRTTNGGQRYGFTETPERRHWNEAKFWTRVDRSGGPNACWPWAGGKPDAYGHTAAGKGMTGSANAHVVAFTLAMGLRKAPDWALVLRHLCDNKPCCNPAHLTPGTIGENIADRWQAQREGRTGPRPVTDPVPPPPGGWCIVTGDLDELDWLARISEFHARVDSSGGPAACWPWRGEKSRNDFGYGQMAFDGQKVVPAHRIAYVIADGKTLADIKGQNILHKCPEAKHRNDCNNPAHLALGTQAENIADKLIHGTMSMGERHHMGQRFPDALVARMREKFWRPTGKRPTMTELALEAGTSVTVISRWLKGTSRPEAGGPLGPTG
ncbi:HNH endonuclease [Streptomyces sp. NPDC004232]|uniref:HNH endonuclease n=1 Tax=Streptomyces sp. NPDC004232 TaxID=3154454 RepID=UPI00339E04E6